MNLKPGEKELITFHTSNDYDMWVDYAQKFDEKDLLEPELEDLITLMKRKAEELEKILKERKVSK